MTIDDRPTHHPLWVKKKIDREELNLSINKTNIAELRTFPYEVYGSLENGDELNR